MQSVSITTNIVSSNPTYGEVYSIHCEIKFVIDLQQVGGCLLFPPSIQLTPRQYWNIVESGVKHHNPNLKLDVWFCIIWKTLKLFYFSSFALFVMNVAFYFPHRKNMYHMKYLKRVITHLNTNDVFYSSLCFLPLEIDNFFLM